MSARRRQPPYVMRPASYWRTRAASMLLTTPSQLALPGSLLLAVQQKIDAPITLGVSGCPSKLTSVVPAMSSVAKPSRLQVAVTSAMVPAVWRVLPYEQSIEPWSGAIVAAPDVH